MSIMNVIEFLVRDVNYIFDDVRTFARLRLTCKLIRSLVDAADVRFTVDKSTPKVNIIVEVDVRGNKYYSMRSWSGYDTLFTSYVYKLHEDRIYKFTYNTLIAICQKKNGKKHGYCCSVSTTPRSGREITVIKQYENGVRLEGSIANLTEFGYRDMNGEILYSNGHLSHWLKSVPEC
jgi:hypothetical protein